MSCKKCRKNPCGCKTTTVILTCEKVASGATPAPECGVGVDVAESCRNPETVTQDFAELPSTACEYGVEQTACDESDETEDDDCDSSDDACDFPTFVTVANAFNMPSCDGTVQLTVVDACRVAVGAALWNPGVGILVVESVGSGTLTAKNRCDSCNALGVGEPVSAGEAFTVGNPPCQLTPGNSPQTPFLDSDFLVPAVDACVNVKVTTTAGLTIGATYSIAGRGFRLGNIIDTTTVQICNDGDGGDVNDPVYSDPNTDGDPDYPFIQIAEENPCDQDPVETLKRLIGCGGSGQRQGLIGAITGQVPFWNQDTEQWELRLINDTTVCVTLGHTLSLDPDNDPTDTYLIDVLPDTNALAIELEKVAPNNLRVSINGDPFCVTDIPDSTHVHVLPAFTVTEITDYDGGAQMCVLECCDQCVPLIEITQLSTETEDEVDVLEATAVVEPTTLTAVATGITVHTIPIGIGSAGDGTEDGDGLWELIFKNGSDGCECKKKVSLFSNFEMSIDMDDDVFANVEFRILQILPTQATFAHAAIPIAGGRRLQAGLNGSPNLLVGGNPGNYYTLNTYKGHIFDRTFLEPGDTCKFQGHVRIVIENNSGDVTDFSYALSWRTWVELIRYKFLKIIEDSES